MTQWPFQASYRSLPRAAGFDDRELESLIIGIANFFDKIIPGHENQNQQTHPALSMNFNCRPYDHNLLFSNHHVDG